MQLGTTCVVTGGQAFVMYPNGSSTLVAGPPTGNGLNGYQQYERNFNFSVPGGSGGPCANDQLQILQCIPSVIGGTDAGCLPITETYVVNAADINIQLGPTVIPNGCGAAFFVAAEPNTIHFEAIGYARKVKDGICEPSGGAVVPVTIVFPGFTITTRCVSTCPAGETGTAQYGKPVNFAVTICNTGAVDLVNINVTNTPAGGSPTFVTTITRLNAGACTTVTNSFTPVGNLCGPFDYTVTAVGQDFNATADPCFQPATISHSASARCTLCQAPCIDVTKTCPPTINNVSCPNGSSLIPFSGVVTNCGDVPLTNVKVVDDNGTPNDTSDDVTFNIGNLAIGGSATYSGSHTVAADFCGPFTNTVTATGDSVCGGAAPPKKASCTTQVNCCCIISVVKEVACFFGTGAGATDPCNLNSGCGTFAKIATGVKDSACPAFCYRITVKNEGFITIAPGDLTLTDDVLGSFTARLRAQLPTAGLAPGASVTVGTNGVAYCANTTNIVTASCSNPGGTGTTVKDTNVVLVLNINLLCLTNLVHSALDVDANSFAVSNNVVISQDDNHVQLPAGSVDVPISITVTLKNDGTSPLLVTNLTVTFNGSPATVTDCAGKTTTPLPISLAAGESKDVVVGCILVSCPGGNINVSGNAIADEGACAECVYDKFGNRISDSFSTCPATVGCEIVSSVLCRVTGGGDLIPGFNDTNCVAVNTTIYPYQSTTAGGTTLTIKKITHGGQLGAPFSHMDCIEATLGNPCIRGQWSHHRHYEGTGNPVDQIDVDFHSQTPKGQYDTLMCACLGCCAPEIGFHGAFTAPGKKFVICNPDDRVCGPEPRPAPANAIIFTGVGRMTRFTDSGGNSKGSEWVVFRVYVEDRSEPGGDKKYAHPPADVYCFQAWKTGIPTSRKADFTTVSPQLRMALTADSCAFLTAMSNGTDTYHGSTQLPGNLPNPLVDGLTADIQDCGPLYVGNQQIHPATGANDNCTDPVVP